MPLNTNYGGLIQAYALQTVIERLGFSACVLDTPRYVLRLDNHMLYLKRMIKKSWDAIMVQYIKRKSIMNLIQL